MRILGIDYGARKVGLAVSDEQGRMSLPLTTLLINNRQDLLIRLGQIIKEQEVSAIVVGVPVSFAAKRTSDLLRDADLQNNQMKEVLEFVSWLKVQFSLPVEMEDESLSTKLANKLRRDLVKKDHDDAVAAMLILQTYLDRHQN